MMKKFLIGLLSVSLLSGCQYLPEKTLEKFSGVLETKLEPAIAALELPPPLAPRPSIDTTLVKIYHADSQCQSLVTDTAQIPSTITNEVMVAATLQNVLEKQQIPNFDVANYNVTLDRGTAIIDINVAATSRRRITSLSSCEQFAFFKAIETTLIQNRALDVSKVIFTQSGKEVYL